MSTNYDDVYDKKPHIYRKNPDGQTHNSYYTANRTCLDCGNVFKKGIEILQEENAAHSFSVESHLQYDAEYHWGEKIRKCSKCDFVESTDEVPKTKHTWSNKTSWAKYNYDEKEHWRIGKRPCTVPGCNCIDNVVELKTAHTFVDGKCVCGEKSNRVFGWSFDGYDIDNPQNLGLMQLQATNMLPYGYNGDRSEMIQDAWTLAFADYEELFYGQAFNAVKSFSSGKKADSSEEFIAKRYYKEALATTTGILYGADPRYDISTSALVAKILSNTGSGIKLEISDKDMEMLDELITTLHEIKVEKLVEAAGLSLDESPEIIDKALKAIDVARENLLKVQALQDVRALGDVAKQVGESISLAMNLYTTYKIANADMSDNIKALKQYKEAYKKTTEYSADIVIASELLASIDVLIAEYENMSVTAVDYFLATVCNKAAGEALDLVGTPVAVYNFAISATGTALDVIGVADDARARQFTTYAESSVVQMMLGGFAPVEEHVANGEFSSITEDDLNFYYVAGEYCYTSRLAQIDKLLESGAATGAEAAELKNMRKQLEAGLEMLRNKTIGVVE